MTNTTLTNSFDARITKWGGITLAVFFLGAFASLPHAAVAEPDHGPGRRTPPPAAFEACAGKTEGTACEMTFKDRTLAGKCVALPDKKIACRPERPMGPPPALIEACKGKTEGAACSATVHDRTIEGTCSEGRKGDLICRPAHKR